MNDFIYVLAIYWLCYWALLISQIAHRLAYL